LIRKSDTGIPTAIAKAVGKQDHLLGLYCKSTSLYLQLQPRVVRQKARVLSPMENILVFEIVNGKRFPEAVGPKFIGL
jgi:hypothetical protein